MKKATKIWLITAAALILVGGMIFGGAMTMLKWDFTKLSTTRYESREHEIAESFDNIRILTDTADITLLPTDGTQCRVVCYEDVKASHEVAVKDDTLTVERIDTRKWYEYIGVNFATPKITVYMPKGEYAALTVKESTGDVNIPREFQFQTVDVSVSTGNVSCSASASGEVKIRATTGDVTLQDMSAGAIDLTVSTGRIKASGITCTGDVAIKVTTGKTLLTDVTCHDLSTNGSTGDIKLTSVIATGTLTVKRSTGNVTFEGCDAAEMSVTTDTGDVKGTLLSDKIFFADTNTGRKDVPQTTAGGKCEIKTDTGDIIISVP